MFICCCKMHYDVAKAFYYQIAKTMSCLFPSHGLISLLRAKSVCRFNPLH